MDPPAPPSSPPHQEADIWRVVVVLVVLRLYSSHISTASFLVAPASLLPLYSLSCISSAVPIRYCPHHPAVSFVVHIIRLLFRLSFASDRIVPSSLLLSKLMSLSGVSFRLCISAVYILINPTFLLLSSSATQIHHTEFLPSTHPCCPTSLPASPLPIVSIIPHLCRPPSLLYQTFPMIACSLH